MRELEIFLKTAAEALRSLAKAVESIGEKMEELAEAERKEKAAAEPVEKKIAIKAEEKVGVEPTEAKVVIKAEEKEAPPEEKRLTAAQAVLDVIKASRKGVDTARLKEKTGFNVKKIRNAIYKLKNDGKIKSERRGVYVKA